MNRFNKGKSLKAGTFVITILGGLIRRLNIAAEMTKTDLTKVSYGLEESYGQPEIQRSAHLHFAPCSTLSKYFVMCSSEKRNRLKFGRLALHFIETVIEELGIEMFSSSDRAHITLL